MSPSLFRSSRPESPTTALHPALRPGRPPLLSVEEVGSAGAWAADNRRAVRSILLSHGCLLIRGLGLGDPAAVAAVVRGISDELAVERESFAPRESRGEVYSSTKWPNTHPMCLHHEVSYRLSVPATMVFACLTPPTAGGATTLADASTVLGELPRELVHRFRQEGWMLTRSYNGDIGASLADSFGTDDRAAIERYCRENAIDVDWQPDGSLRTRQRRAAVVTHPRTGQPCWFNQIAFLSEWTLAPELREFLIDVYGADGLPFNTRFGGGDPIDRDVIDLINATYDAHTSRASWQAGDLLILDNVRTAHGREPYTGQREVVVALTDPVRLEGDPGPAGGSSR